MTLKRRTCHELLIALGFDRSPSEMGALSTVLVTAMSSLSRESKADIIQHLHFPAPDGPRPCGVCGGHACTCSLRAERPEQEPQSALCEHGNLGYVCGCKPMPALTQVARRRAEFEALCAQVRPPEVSLLAGSPGPLRPRVPDACDYCGGGDLCYPDCITLPKQEP